MRKEQAINATCKWCDITLDHNAPGAWAALGAGSRYLRVSDVYSVGRCKLGPFRHVCYDTFRLTRYQHTSRFALTCKAGVSQGARGEAPGGTV